MLEKFHEIKFDDDLKIIIMDDLRLKKPELFNDSGAMNYPMFEKDIRPHNFIYVRKDKNSLSFTLQNGPIKEVGVNGCQIDDILVVAKELLNQLNENFSCIENKQAISCVNKAIYYLKMRKADRVNRKVEGYNKP
jgi:hypothetical protein